MSCELLIPEFILGPSDSVIPLIRVTLIMNISTHSWLLIFSDTFTFSFTNPSWTIQIKLTSILSDFSEKMGTVPGPLKMYLKIWIKSEQGETPKTCWLYTCLMSIIGCVLKKSRCAGFDEYCIPLRNCHRFLAKFFAKSGVQPLCEALKKLW